MRVAIIGGGILAIFARYSSMRWEEFKRSCVKHLFCRSLQRLVPEIQVGDLADGGAGVRAQALLSTDELLQDLCLSCDLEPPIVLNAPSPAGAACLPIAYDTLDGAKDVYGLVRLKALDQAPLSVWQLPDCFTQLRRLLEARLNDCRDQRPHIGAQPDGPHSALASNSSDQA